jgi:hypothetical protein
MQMNGFDSGILVVEKYVMINWKNYYWKWKYRSNGVLAFFFFINKKYGYYAKQFLVVESLPKLDQAEMMHSTRKKKREMMSQMEAISPGWLSPWVFFYKRIEIKFVKN